jgi:hypothetical protein
MKNVVFWDVSPCKTSQKTTFFTNSLIVFGIRKIARSEEGVCIIVPVHEKCNKTDCDSYHGIPLSSTSCRIL